MPIDLRHILLSGARAVAASIVLAGGARAELRVNESAGYKLDVPASFMRLQVPYGMLGFHLPSDYYLLECFAGREDLPLRDRLTPYRRQVFVYYFPRLSDGEIAALKTARGSLDANRRRKLDAWFSLDYIPHDFGEYVRHATQAFRFGTPEPHPIGGLDGTLEEVTVDSSAGVGHRWLVESLKVQKGIVAIVVTCAEQDFSALRSESQKIIDSFRLLESGFRARDPQGGSGVVLKDVNTITPAERIEQQRAERQRAFKEALASIDSGSKSFETDHFLVIHDCDAGTARDAARHAEALEDWLASRFPGVGGSPTQAMILVVRAKLSVLDSGTEPPFFGNPDEVRRIEVAKPLSHGNAVMFQRLTRAVMHVWFDQRCPGLWDHVPAFLALGLDTYVGDLTLASGKAAFPSGIHERNYYRDMRDEQERYKRTKEDPPLMSLEFLFHAWKPENFGEKATTVARAQAVAVVRYLVEGPGSKSQRLANVIPGYVAELADGIALATKSPDAGAAAKTAKDAFEDQTSKLHRAVFTKLFGAWTAKEWAEFERDWWAYAADLK